MQDADVCFCKRDISEFTDSRDQTKKSFKAGAYPTLLLDFDFKTLKKGLYGGNSLGRAKKF